MLPMAMPATDRLNGLYELHLPVISVDCLESG